jgi:hypothetical protein
MKNLLFAVLFAAGFGLTAAGQTISFSPQGAAELKAETGKTIHGFQLVSVLTCSDGEQVVAGGKLYQAAGAAGYAWLDPEASRAVILRASSFTWSRMIPNLIQDASLGFSTLIAARVIAAPAAVLQGLLSAHGIFEIASSRIQANAVDPTGVLGRLIPRDAAIALGAGQCHTGLIGAVYPNPRATKLAIAPVFDEQLAARIVGAHLRALAASQDFLNQEAFSGR